MEMEPQERHSTQLGEIQASPPSKELLAVITKWVGIFMEHFHKEISDLGMVGYIEGLKDLNPVQVESACRKALREVDRMPSVAHIRARIFGSCIGTRPTYPDAPPMSEEDRAEALKYSEALRETLGKMDEEEEKVYTVFNEALPELDMRTYLRWLEEQ